jgi:iron complex outermembrane receptor protein
VLACTDSQTFQCTDVIGALLRRSAGFIAKQTGEVAFLNRAIYGQATFAATDKLSLTGGLRYTWDRSTAAAQLINYRISSPTGQPQAPVGSCVLAAADADCRTYAITKSEAPTWLLSADYKITPDILVYANYSRGYRQGSVTYNAPPPYQATSPEHLDAYEVGAKTSFDGPIPGMFNVAGFYNTLTNQQISVNLQSSTNATTPTSVIQNAGSSLISGAEAELTLNPIAGLTIDANFEYLHTKIESLDVVVLGGSLYDRILPTATAGSRLPFTPTQKWSITGTYDFPSSGLLGTVSASATYARSGDYVYSTGPFGVIESVGLLNGSINWRSVLHTPMDISLYGTNLTGEEYYTTATDLTTNGGFVSNVVGAPRMYGVRLRYNFGG